MGARQHGGAQSWGVVAVTAAAALCLYGGCRVLMRDVPLPRLVGFELSFPFSHHLVCVAFLHGDLGYKKS
jgi:hypothetical protein